MTLKNQNWVLKFGFILDVLCTQSKLNIQTQIFTYINFNFTLNQQLGGWILDTWVLQQDDDPKHKHTWKMFFGMNKAD